MVRFETYTCVKCGRTFTKAVGGIVMTPKEMELKLRPVCDRCKVSKITDILKREK